MNKNPSIMAPHNFSVAPSVVQPRSQFRMPHGHKFTADFDKIYPIFYAEAPPVDRDWETLKLCGAMIEGF